MSFLRGTENPQGKDELAFMKDILEPAAPAGVNKAKIADLRKKLRSQLLTKIDEADSWERTDIEKQRLILQRLQTLLQSMGTPVTKEEFEQLREGLLDDVLGFGAIQPLIQDETCNEIMVNGPDLIFAEFKGHIKKTPLTFDDEEHILWTAHRIVRPMQRLLNRANPMVDARLPDGSRVHIITPPSALKGTTITIRKFPSKPLTVDDLVSYGSFTREVGEFLRACIAARLNVIVAGGTGSGKTTLLNVLSAFIPNDERIVTIEDAAELQLTQRHVVRLETAPPLPGGDGKLGMLAVRDLVKGSLRMRPDRIVVGECRGGEALDMLQAMNTGHDGSLTTVHANSPRDAISKLETLCLMAGMDLPVDVIRQQIVSAVNLIIQQSRLKDGSRKVVQITEIQGMQGDQVTMQDLFVYKLPGQTTLDPAQTGGGKLEATGYRPNFMEQLEQSGFKLGARIFGSGKR